VGTGGGKAGGLNIYFKNDLKLYFLLEFYFCLVSDSKLII
jgi:hypothetical protein